MKEIKPALSNGRVGDVWTGGAPSPRATRMLAEPHRPAGTHWLLFLTAQHQGYPVQCGSAAVYGSVVKIVALGLLGLSSKPSSAPQELMTVGKLCLQSSNSLSLRLPLRDS